MAHMRIEHVAMYVNDLERAKSFFETYFDATSNELYHNKETGFRSYFLAFDSGARLEIMQKPLMYDMDKPIARTGFIHLAFSVGSKEKVLSLTHALIEGGYEILSEPRVIGDGYYESCILDLESNQIEIKV